MPDNVLWIPGQIFSVVVGMIVLFGAGLAFGLRDRMRVKPGSSGHRPAEEQGETETIGPDGYIDSFTGRVAEGGGSIPMAAKIIAAVLVVAYFAYLFLFWQSG